ncbi:MAG: NADPH-dependent F420 reductase [Conexivisphaerales archaeon]|nr:NADPH-dependent F420 reductase [Conexivisphaerales archaeon]
MRASPSIAILGGTGDLGEGLALRLCPGRNVMIGSRDPTRAASRAAEYAERSGCAGIEGSGNADAAARADYVILAAPADALPGLLDEIAGHIREESLVVSPVVPMSRRNGVFVHDVSALDPGSSSAAEYVAKRLGRRIRVAAAFHTIPAGMLSDVGKRLDVDVLVASDDVSFRALSEDLRVDGIRYLHAGPLELARYLEQLVPLLLNVGRRNGIRNPSLKVI